MGKGKSETVRKILLPSERYRALTNILKLTAEICGCNFDVPDYQYTFMTYLTMTLAGSFIVLTVYTMAEAFLKRDWLNMLQALCYSGLGLQGSSKLTSALNHYRLVQWLHMELQQVLATYERQAGQYAHYMNLSLDHIKKMIFSLAAIYSVATTLMLLVPIAYGLYHKEPIALMHYTVPVLDLTTHFGQNALRVVHGASIVIGMFGNFTSDSFLFLIVGKIPMLKNVMQCKLDKLDELLTEYPGNSAKTMPMLKDIVLWHQKYMYISSEIKSMYFWVIFFQISSTFLCIVSCIICLFIGAFPVGMVIICFAFITMFSYCSLGNLVELANESAIEMIYNVKWYELTVPEQKMVLIMLRQSQQIEGMSIGGVMELTMNAGVQVTKTIYSIAMMLNKFFN